MLALRQAQTESPIDRAPRILQIAFARSLLFCPLKRRFWHFNLLLRLLLPCERLLRLLDLGHPKISHKRLGHSNEIRIVRVKLLICFVVWDRCVRLSWLFLLFVFVHLLIKHPQLHGERVKLRPLRLLRRNDRLMIQLHRRIQPLVAAQICELKFICLLELQEVHLVPLLIKIVLISLINSNDSLFVHTL